MNPSNTPQLAENAAAVGVVLTRTEADIIDSVEQKVMGIGCVELIGKLENVFAKATEMSRQDYIDEAAETARKMLKPLSDFCQQHLTGDAATQALEEISKAETFTHAYDEVLKTRPIGNALLRAFWKAEEIDEIKDAHARLADSLIRATAATMYHAIMMIGFETSMGKEIDQSTVVFVTELSQSWANPERR